MGIYDREYYRRDGPSFLGSLNGRSVCFWLIVVNIVCFLLQILTQTRVAVYGGYEVIQPFTSWLDLNVQAVQQGQVWRLLSYGFLHDTEDIWHIVMNMLFLFWFGRQIEEQLGAREFLAFYLSSVVIGGLAYTAASLLGLFHAAALGASGGVMAVLVLAALYYPRQVIYLFFIIPVPIWGFVAALVAFDAFRLLTQNNGGVATAAHLGGAAFGYAYYRLHWRLTQFFPALSSWTQQVARPRARPRLRLYHENEESTPSPMPPTRPTPPPMLEDEQLEAQVDAILAKIHHGGQESLTEHEREVLLRASEAIKRRRG